MAEKVWNGKLTTNEEGEKVLHWRDQCITRLTSRFETGTPGPSRRVTNGELKPGVVIWPDGTTTDMASLEADALNFVGACLSANFEVLRVRLYIHSKWEETWRLDRLLVSVANLPDGKDVQVREEKYILLTLPSRSWR